MATRGNINGITSYQHSRIHILLNRKYGAASTCENKECQNIGIRRYEWALIKGKSYSLNRDDYMQLCVSCHRKYDDSPERRRRLSEANRGKVCHNRSRVLCQFDNEWNYIETYSSSAEAERQTDISHSAIYQSIRKKCKSGGFYWAHMS